MASCRLCRERFTEVTIDYLGRLRAYRREMERDLENETDDHERGKIAHEIHALGRVEELMDRSMTPWL